MAGEFYLSGLTNTGFDYQAFLAKYQEIKLINIEKLQNNQSLLHAKKDAVSQIAEKLKAFTDALSALKSDTSYNIKTATLSNPDIADVSVTTDAIESNYLLNVDQLAKASSYKIGTTNTITDINDTISTSGSLTINYLKDGVVSSLTIDYTNKSLENIMDEINNSSDLQASIINLGTSTSANYQLIITSKNTGSSNTIIGIDDSSNPGDDSAGVFSEDLSKTYETIAAQDAKITLNGIQFTSSNNTFSNIITGVNITVKDTGSSDLTIAKDVSSIQEHVESIVNSYNDLIDTITDLTGRNQPLAGESSFKYMVSRIAGIILDDLGQYGFINSGVTARGRLSVDAEKFEEFINSEDYSTILKNFASNLENYIDSYVDTTDNITQKYDRQISYIDERITFMVDRINEEIERMRNQFIKLEIYMAEMQSLQLRIQNFVAGLNGTPNTNQ